MSAYPIGSREWREDHAADCRGEGPTDMEAWLVAQWRAGGREAIRKLKGRGPRVGYAQAEYRDGRVIRHFKSHVREPMFDLYVARRNVLNGFGFLIIGGPEARARANLYYGELLQTIVSPVPLPADPEPVAPAARRVAA